MTQGHYLYIVLWVVISSLDGNKRDVCSISTAVPYFCHCYHCTTIDPCNTVRILFRHGGSWLITLSITGYIPELNLVLYISNSKHKFYVRVWNYIHWWGVIKWFTWTTTSRKYNRCMADLGKHHNHNIITHNWESIETQIQAWLWWTCLKPHYYYYYYYYYYYHYYFYCYLTMMHKIKNCRHKDIKPTCMTYLKFTPYCGPFFKR